MADCCTAKKDCQTVNLLLRESWCNFKLRTDVPQRPGYLLAASQTASPASDLDSTARLGWRRRLAASSGLKRAFDVTVVITVLLLLLPLIVTVIAVLMVAQGRPVIYRHPRIGRGGATFHCFKFRTMATDGDALLRAHLSRDAAARAEWEATRKLKDDPRITPIGRLLRKSSADELPQILNVLRGEMSLVGPRPIVGDEVRYYGGHIQHYQRVKPGLTGAWQISGRNDTSYAERVRLDAHYVATQSFVGDIAILLRTVPAVLRARGSY